MFKKPEDVQERSKSLMRKKDIQKLRADIMKQMPLVTEDSLATLFHNKANVECCKLMSKTLLYLSDGVPYFYDENGRNKLFPTLQFLWLHPNCVRQFLIHHHVSKFVLNGADLMLPGVAVVANLTDLEVGETCCVYVLKCLTLIELLDISLCA